MLVPVLNKFAGFTAVSVQICTPNVLLGAAVFVLSRYC